ncbi:MAG: PEP-CTERM sorting domain-containing protein [Fimbriimonadaceae bacterium]|nr:MAG: PEP-CTERM sorting domain-containing protein [Fimbriimonadaceae bacterium]
MTSRSLVIVAFAAISVQAHALSWTTVLQTNSSTTSSLRSVALAQDGASVYAGYIQNSARDVHRFDTTSLAMIDSRDGAAGSSLQPKAIATDDRGNVFVLNRNTGTNISSIYVHNANLSDVSNMNIGGVQVGGAWVNKVGNDYLLYVSREAGGAIERYNVNNTGAMTLDTTFGTGGTLTVSGGGALRDLQVAADGTIFVADRDNNKVFRIDGTTNAQTNVTLTRAMGVALYGGKMYATSYNGLNSKISVFDQTTLSFVEDLGVDTLDGNAYVRGGNGEGWAFIDIGTDGRIWMADQLFASNQDRFIVSEAQAVPEPATLTVLGAAALAAFARKRRK